MTGASMTKQLNVRNDEVYRLAHDIAEAAGAPIADVIAAACATTARSCPSVEN